jgi:hypothetical protein
MRRKFSSELKWVEIAIDKGAEYLASHQAYAMQIMIEVHGFSLRWLMCSTYGDTWMGLFIRLKHPQIEGNVIYD